MSSFWVFTEDIILSFQAPVLLHREADGGHQANLGLGDKSDLQRDGIGLIYLEGQQHIIQDRLPSPCDTLLT